MSSLGQLYVIAAPSGGGKTRLVRALVEADPQIIVSVSCTTRPPRPSDQEGVDYFFKTDDEFDQMIKDNAFIEYAEVFGCRYGTSHRWVIEQLGQGRDVILEIDWQGARQIKQLFSQVVTIFIIPPALDVLLTRLNTRQQDSKAVIQRRMGQAKNEMRHFYEFDYLIVNDDFEDLLRDATHIIRSQRLKIDRQSNKLSSLLAELTKND